MEINYSVQPINNHNQKLLEENLIIEYFEENSEKSYLLFLKEKMQSYLDDLRGYTDKYFPTIEDAILKHYTPTNFGFFVNKNTEIPHLFVDSDLHRTMLLDIRLDISQRLDTLILLQNVEVFNLIEKGYDKILKLTGQYWDKVCEYQYNYTYIKNIYDKELEKIKERNINNSAKQKTEEESEPLTVKQVQKIGLLFRSGIIDYLKTNNPRMSNNQIAGFLDLLTTERIKQGSIGSHLNKDSSKYPIQNQQDKDDLDLILKKYGINPQS